MCYICNSIEEGRPLRDPILGFPDHAGMTVDEAKDVAVWQGVEVPVTDAPQKVSVRNISNDDSFETVFEDLADEALELLVQRQKKYGPENVATQGFYGIFTRLASDKIERLRRAHNGKIAEGKIELDAFTDSEDETIEDTILDIINYGLILLAVKRGLWGRPLRGSK